MLRAAQEYEEQLKSRWQKTWFDEKYKFFHCGSYYDEIVIDKETWNKHQFVSVDSKDHVVGYIAYKISRDSYIVSGLQIINFTDKSTVFGVDLYKALKDIFERYRFAKLVFSVCVGNPAEKGYDRLVSKCNGRIVGTFCKDIRLIDGKYYDQKFYEITENQYLSK